MWFKRGKGTHIVDFRASRIDDDTLYGLAPGQVHAFGRDTEGEGAVIHFDERLLADEGTETLVFLRYKVFGAGGDCPAFRLSARVSAEVDELVRRLEREARANERAFGHVEALRCWIRLLLIAVERSADERCGDEMRRGSAQEHTYARFAALVEDNYKTLHKVEAYAERLGVSRRTLSAAVATVGGRSPLRMIVERIVLEAKRRLFFTPVSVKELAFELGFGEPSYFVKFFVREAGCTPEQFRQRSREADIHRS